MIMPHGSSSTPPVANRRWSRPSRLNTSTAPCTLDVTPGAGGDDHPPRLAEPPPGRDPARGPAVEAEHVDGPVHAGRAPGGGRVAHVDLPADRRDVVGGEPARQARILEDVVQLPPA